jgi:multiple sugar transport system permease protein
MWENTVSKFAKKTLFYILITSLIIIILTPLYFLVSLSFLSSREAYQFPLPLVPAISSEFKLEKGDKGYMLSIYEKGDREYQTMLDTSDMEKISIEKLENYISKLDQQNEVYFKSYKGLLHNYKTFFAITRDAVPALIRSLQVAGLTILISLSIGGMAGYAFARYIFKGKNTLKVSVLFVRVFPAVAIAMPMVIILATMGFYDKPIGLSLVYSVGTIALTIWVTASIFLGIPVELEEAAQIFGATKLRTFINITIPLALPGLAACAMYAFIGAWNETVSAIILTQFNPTFAVVVYQTLLGASAQVNLAAAGGILMALPMVLFTLFIRKYINQMWGGVTA